MGDPLLVEQDQFLQRLQEELLVDLGHAEPLRRDVHPPDIFHRPEEEDGAAFSPVGLHPLEDLLGVVEAHGRRIELERPVGFDQGVMPAPAGVVGHGEEMIGEDLSEAQFRFIGGFRLPLFRRGLNNLDFHCRLLNANTLEMVSDGCILYH